MTNVQQSSTLARAGRRSTDSYVAPSTHLPAWAVYALIALMVANVVLAGTLVRSKLSPPKQEAPAYGTIGELEGQLEKSPNDPKILLQLGFEYRKAGMLDDAIRVNQDLADMDPNNMSARYHIGSIFAAMGDDKQAEGAFWDVLEVEPAHVLAAKELGELYARRKQYKSLVVAVEAAAIEHPEVAELQYLWGLGKEGTGNLAGAKRAYWLAMERDPNLDAARAGYDRLSVQ